MNFEIILAITTTIGLLFLIQAIKYRYCDVGFSARSTISTIIGIALIFIPQALFYIIPHNENCTCSRCYKYVGTVQGITLYMNKNEEMYYSDEINNEYTKITQNDGTSYTYSEYLQNQLKEIK